MAAILDMLSSGLDLDLVVAYVFHKGESGPSLSAKVARSSVLSCTSDQICAALTAVPQDEQAWRRLLRQFGMTNDWSMVIIALGVEDIGELVAVTRRRGFPTDDERLLLGLAALQARVAVQAADNARLQLKLSEKLSVEQRHRAIVEMTPECVKLLARDGTVLGVNRAGVAMAGAPSADLLIGRNFLDFVVPEDRERYRGFHEAVLEGHKGHIEYDMINAQGERRQMESHATPLLGDDGTIVQLGLSRDITSRKQADEKLRRTTAMLVEAQRAASLGELTASIAHEVNQPLSGIVTNAGTCLRMLLAESPDLDGARETARRMMRDANRASEIVMRLRGLYAHEGIKAERVDVNDAAREVLALMSSDLQANRVILRAKLSVDVPAITGDRIQLQQVMLNLIRNGSEAMSDIEDRPRLLTIATRLEHEAGVTVSVQDRGVGFDREAAERLFDSFYSTKRNGMGIGLSVSRSIIERHEGRLWAEANRDGPGVTFAFSVPCGSQPRL